MPQCEAMSNVCTLECRRAKKSMSNIQQVASAYIYLCESPTVMQEYLVVSYMPTDLCFKEHSYSVFRRDRV
jgi:hypothetical protein